MNVIAYTMIALLFLSNIEWSKAQSAIESTQDFVMKDLQSKKLNQEQLSNYEAQAILKLKDLLDYIEIIGSAKYNREMRKTALKTVLNYFEKDAKVPCDWIEIIDDYNSPKQELKKGERPNCRPEQLLKKLLERSFYETKINCSSLHVRKNLTDQENGKFIGTLYYEEQYFIKNDVESEDLKGQLKKIMRLDFVLKRVKKKFGKEEEWVWEISFEGWL